MKALILVCLFFVNAKLIAQQTLTQLVKTNENAVFIIITYDKYGNPLAQGSGFFIDSNGTGITNVHVLENSAKAEIKTLNNKNYTINKIIAYNENYDLLKFTVNNSVKEKFSFVRISKDKPQKGEDVFVIGNPMGLESTVSNGIVASVREMDGYGTTIQISAPISPGSSGGPVFNMKGKVIGVATFGITKGQNLNFAVDINRIYELGATKNEDLLVASKSINYDEAMLKGLDAFNTKGWAIAISYFEQALEKSNDKSELYNYLGKCYYYLNDSKKAMDYFNMSLAINPNSGVYANRAIVEEMLNEHAAALADFNKYIELYPNKADGYFGRASVYTNIQKYDDALADLNQAIALEPNSSTAFNTLGRYYDNLGNYERALIQYNHAIELDPNNPYAFQYRGFLYWEIKKATEALSDFNRTIELDPHNADAYFGKGQVKEDYLNDSYGAISEYTKAIELDPKYDFAYARRGGVKFGLNDYRNALSDLLTYLRLAPTGDAAANSYDLAGLCYSKLGDNSSACDMFKKAVAHGSSNAQRHVQNCY